MTQKQPVIAFFKETLLEICTNIVQSHPENCQGPSQKLVVILKANIVHSSNWPPKASLSSLVCVGRKFEVRGWGVTSTSSILEPLSSAV